VARYRLASPLEAFRVGDIPGQLRLELVTLDGTPVALAGITGATAALVSPAGVETTPAVTVDEDELVLALVDELDEAGLYELELVVAGAVSSIAVEPALFVVEAKRTGWHTLASARAQWADAPRLDISLYTFLAGAREQIVEYGPELAAGVRVPLSWQQAQLMQARNCWNAAKTDPASGGIGGDDLVFRPYPMDQTVRYLIRPKRAAGATA
jgi:hypothetical protein